MVLLLDCSAAFSAQATESQGEALTLESALRIARTENRQIQAAEARYQAMSQRPIQERTLPDPMLGLKYHNEQFDRLTFGESEFSFFEFSGRQEVPFPGKLGLRGEVAARDAEREGAMRDATVLMVLAKVATAYADLMVNDRSRSILHQSSDALELITRQAATSYAVGAVTQQDVLRATLERGGLSERLTMLEQKRTAAEATINALLNRAANEPLPPTTWSDPVASLSPLSELTGTLAREAPELRAAQEEVLKSNSAVELAQREYYPDFALMGAYTNKNGLFPEWEVGVEVKVPLYFWRRQRAALAEASYLRSAAERTRQNLRVTLEGRLRELYSMADAALRLVRLYQDTLIPQARLTLESARASYAVGKVDFLTTLTAFTALLEYQMRYAEEVGNLARSRAEIAAIIGQTPLGERITP